MKVNKENQKVEIQIGNTIICQDNFTMIAGPCAVESKEQFDIICREIETPFIRGGAFKPRTSPYDFQGLKNEGLKIMVEAKTKYNKFITTELLAVEDLQYFDEVDIIQIGARNMQNFSLLMAAAKTNKPILLKRGMGNTIDEFINAAEYIANMGNINIIMCERGIRTFEHATRFTLDIASIYEVKSRTNLPIFVDPSHAAGKVELVESLALAAVAAGCNGLLIEVHPNPKDALSDKKQQLTIKEYNTLVEKVNHVRTKN